MSAIRFEGHLSVNQVSRLCRGGGGKCYPDLVQRICRYYGIPVKKRSAVSFVPLDRVREVQGLVYEHQLRVRMNREIRQTRRSECTVCRSLGSSE